MKGYKYSKGAIGMSKSLVLDGCDWKVGYVEFCGWCVIVEPYGYNRHHTAYGRYTEFVPVVECSDGTYSRFKE